MKKISSVLSTIFTTLILIFGFQNCGKSSFSGSDLVESEPLSSINIDDTKYKDGLSFNSLSTTNDKTVSDFQVQKTSDQSYAAKTGNDIITCVLDNPNPMEELMQITEVATVTHPTFLSEVDVCEPKDEKFIHFKIGEDSPVHLISYTQDENCLTDDPRRLLAEGHRVFIIENISFEEIETLIEESKALSKTELCSVNSTVDDSGLY